MPGMALALTIFGIAFAAICIWLTVRIVNRRERWAKWTLAAVIAMPVLYVASFGPACWISSRTETGAGMVAIVYQPVIKIIFEPAAPDFVRISIVKYAELLSSRGWMFSRTSDQCRWGVVI
jgi:hypothetical protein